MRIISWNIQCGLGVDGRVDLGRIADVIADMGPADVVCLQEVARFNPEMDGGACHDQLEQLASHFPGYETLFGAAIDRNHSETGRRWQFGNAILTNLPVIQTFAHPLPQPAPARQVKHMPRQALEAVVMKGGIPWQIVTTHLEFHSKTQRVAQMQRLRSLFDETLANQGYSPEAPGDDPYAATPRPARTVLCGDFNAEPDDEDYKTLLQPFDGTGNRFYDAWHALNDAAPHAPTCGLFDRQQWPQGPHCRDHFFVSKDITDAVSDFQVQSMTDASDHQPLALTLST